MKKFTYRTLPNGKKIRTTHSLECTVVESLVKQEKTFFTHSELVDALGSDTGEVKYVGKTKDGKYILVHPEANVLDLPRNIRFPHLRGTVILAHHVGWNNLPYSVKPSPLGSFRLY